MNKDWTPPPPVTPIYAEMQKEMVWDIPPIRLPKGTCEVCGSTYNINGCYPDPKHAGFSFCRNRDTY